MKSFKMYALIWVIGLIMFNAAVFIVRSAITENASFGASFWIAWVFSSFAFIGNLVCAWFTFKTENLQKLFYKLPLVTISWSALCAMLIADGVFILIPNFPGWLTAIISLAILAFNAIAVIKAVWAADIVETVDVKVKTQTAFIKCITVDAEGLVARAKSEAVKAECQKVYEAIRYSDPMSSSELSDIETSIAVIFKDLSGVVDDDNGEKVKEIADKLIVLVDDRNKKCKLLKQRD